MVTLALAVTVAVGAGGVLAGLIALVSRSGRGWLGVVLGIAAVGVGFLGTVVGLISSFSAVHDADPAAKSALLSRNIASAMISTAAGLVLGVVGIVLGAVAMSRRDRAPRED